MSRQNDFCAQRCPKCQYRTNQEGIERYVDICITCPKPRHVVNPPRTPIVHPIGDDCEHPENKTGPAQVDVLPLVPVFEQCPGPQSLRIVSFGSWWRTR